MLLLLQYLGQRDRRIEFVVSPYSSTVRASVEPLRARLSAELGLPVILRVAANYREAIEAVRNDEVDLGLLTANSYAKARERNSSIEALATVSTDAGEFYYSSFVVKGVGGGIDDLDDVRKGDATVCLGDLDSTSGRLIPNLVLGGPIVESRVREAEGHDSALKMLLRGECAVAAVASSEFEAWKQRASDGDAGKLREIHKVDCEIPFDALVRAPGVRGTRATWLESAVTRLIGASEKKRWPADPDLSTTAITGLSKPSSVGYGEIVALRKAKAKDTPCR